MCGVNGLTKRNKVVEFGTPIFAISAFTWDVHKSFEIEHRRYAGAYGAFIHSQMKRRHIAGDMVFYGCNFYS